VTNNSSQIDPVGDVDMRPPPYPRGAEEVARVALDALRAIGADTAKGIAELERILRGRPEPLPFPPGPATERSTGATASENDSQLQEVLAAVHAKIGVGSAGGASSGILMRRPRDDDDAGDGPLPRPHPTPRPAPAPAGASAGLGPYPTQPPTFVEAFFWGVHLVIPHEAMIWLDTAFGLGLIGDAAVLGAVLGPAIAAATAVPVAGWVLAGLFVVLMATWGACHACDRGNGIYLSMLWVAPGILVPTTR